jgi:hypothetical protein
MLQCFPQKERIQNFLASEGCEWKFIPQHGPHSRGLREAAVISTKHHLCHSLGTQIAIYEELCKLLSEREVCLNSRPLCALSNDPLDPSYLSPGHFLIGEPFTQLPTLLTILMSNAAGFPDGRIFNNIYNIYGNTGHPTAYWCSSVIVGKDHPLIIHNQQMSYC